MYFATNNKKALLAEKCLTYATLITCIRLVLILPIVYFIQTEQWVDAFWWFVSAAVTDGIDGAVARGMNECTLFGEVFDAFVDKVFIVSVTVALMSMRYFTCWIPIWFYYFVLVKESVQLVGVCLLYWYCGYIEIKPLILGKCTMFLYFVLTSLVLYQAMYNSKIEGFIYLLVCVVGIASVSFMQYVCVAYSLAKQKIVGRAQ